MKQLAARQEGAVLVSVIVGAVVLLLMVGALTTFQVTNSRHERSTEDELLADYIAAAGLHHSFHDVSTGLDPDGNGLLGELGLETPVPFTGEEEGTVLGEYRAFAVNGSGPPTLRVIAAVPSFEAPTVLRVVEAGIQGEVGFDLALRPGAMVISSDLDDLDLHHFGEANLLIDGGESAAIAMTTESSYEMMMNELESLIASGDLPPDALQGDLTTVLDGPELPVIESEMPFLSAEEIDEYRHELRDAALAVQGTADRVISTPIVGDVIWGTTDAPEVTFLDTTGMGGQDVFATPNQTVQGVGTLVVYGDFRTEDNLNLDWQGDIIVIGEQGGGDDVVRFHGTQADIDGSLLLLAADHGEGSVLIDESDGALRRPSDIDIQGAFLAMSDADDRRIELRIDTNSSLTVQGFLGLFGNEVWCEVHDESASLDVQGTFLAGLPQGGDSPSDQERFRFRPRGATSLVYDEGLVSSALSGMGRLEEVFGVDGSDDQIYDRFRLRGVVANPISGEEALEDLRARLEAGQAVGIALEEILVPSGQ